jgi:cysteine-rich repeat protein
MRASAVVFVCAGILLASASGSAATLTVNSAGDGPPATDGVVTLREAILAAEADGTTELGQSGSGADTIVFAPELTAAGDVLIPLDTVGDTELGPAAFAITTSITIAGPAGGRGIVLGRALGAPAFRHFSVTGTLVLENLTIGEGFADGGDGGANSGDDGGGGGGGAGLGGAIYNRGSLTVRACTLVGNTARGGNGGGSAPKIGANAGGGGGGGGLGGNGGAVAGNDDGGGGGGGTRGAGAAAGAEGGGGGGGTDTNGAPGTGATGGAGGAENGGDGGNGDATDGTDAGPGGGGGGGGIQRSGGDGGFGGGGGGSGESDGITVLGGGFGGFGGGGGGGGRDATGGVGGFGGGGAGGSRAGGGASGGFGAGDSGAGPYGVDSGGGGGAAGLGGAIFNHNGSVALVNSTFAQNETIGGFGGPAGSGSAAGGNGFGVGGAVFNLNGAVTVESSTFDDNNAARGSDVFNLAHGAAPGIVQADATVSFANSILQSSSASNVETAIFGTSPGAAVASGDATDIILLGILNTGGTVNDGGIRTLSAQLGELRDNGGPTPTLAPSIPSPAIDTGDSDAAVDQRGVARPQGTADDVGSVEVSRLATALAPGDLLLTEGTPGTVVDIQDGGDFALAPRFAFGLSTPAGICAGPGGEIYVAESGAGQVTVITAGGDFTGAPAFASGLALPFDLLCTDTQILVSEAGSGEVTDVTAGGDFAGDPAFATGIPVPVGLLRDSTGKLWVASGDGIVLDISAGGDFTGEPGYVTGAGVASGVAERGAALLLTNPVADEVRDFTAGGAYAALPVFADVPAPTNLVDLGTLGLFAPSAAADAVFEISAGGDFIGAPPFASGVDTSALFADLALVRGCGDGILDAGTEECDDGNVAEGDGCTASCEARCAPAPEPACIAAGAASVKLDERKPGKEKLAASLKKLADAVTQADLGDPVAGDTRFALCLYDASDALALDLRVARAGDTCGPKAKPCWKAIKTTGFGYKDPAAEASGTASLVAKGGKAGKGSVVLQGRNNVPKGQDDLPTGAAAALAGQTSATLQITTSAGFCASAELGVQKAEGGQFKAKAP